ncbi:Homeobox protein knotted-1-like [Asimina triloba]
MWRARVSSDRVPQRFQGAGLRWRGERVARMRTRSHDLTRAHLKNGRDLPCVTEWSRSCQGSSAAVARLQFGTRAGGLGGRPHVCVRGSDQFRQLLYIYTQKQKLICPATGIRFDFSMEEMYGLPPTVHYAAQPSMSPDNLVVSQADLQSIISASAFRDRIPIFGSDPIFHAPAISDASISPEIRAGDELSSAIKAKIAAHPRYPRLLEAYIDCQKVGAPPEVASLLDEIRRENDVSKLNAVSTRLGVDPELDEFMETYCDVLVKYKTDLARPFDEATTFLNNIEMQLSNLCKGASRSCPPEASTLLSPATGATNLRHRITPTRLDCSSFSGPCRVVEQSSGKGEKREKKKKNSIPILGIATVLILEEQQVCHGGMFTLPCGGNGFCGSPSRCPNEKWKAAYNDNQ